MLQMNQKQVFCDRVDRVDVIQGGPRRQKTKLKNETGGQLCGPIHKIFQTQGENQDI